MLSGDRLAAAVWIVGLGVMGAYDIAAVIAHSRLMPTLTSFAVRRVPAWITLAFFGWCVVHFAVRYWRR